MGLGLAGLARRFALVVAGSCWLLLAALAWSRLCLASFGSSLLFLVIACLGLPWPALVCSGLTLAVLGCCWLLLAALVLGPGVPWLAALLWFFLAVVGCCCWLLFAGPGRLWLFSK